MHCLRGLYFVQLRRGRRYDAAREPGAAQLEGRTFMFRPGWQLGPECGGIFTNEMAMVSVDTDPAHPYPEDAPIWLPSGDLYPVGDRAQRDLVEQAK